MSRRGRFAWLRAACALCAGVVLSPAGAASPPVVRTFSPQNEVATVRQVRATFSVPMVQFGDPRLPAPFQVRCPSAGTGRWVDDRTWLYDFAADVPPGTRCSFELEPGTRSKDGAAVVGKTAFSFSTGGPAIVRSFPSAGGSEIDEEQVFVLVLNGPATTATVTANAWCEVTGVGERVPVRLVEGTDRTELLKRFGLGGRADPVTMVSCARRLPADAKVVLVWGKGIAATTGVVTTVERRLAFEVRSDFTASFTCERENAQAGCTPVRPVRLAFTSPIARTVAERFVLRFAEGGRTVERRPAFDPDDRAASVSEVVFKPPFAENTPLTIDAPPGLVDDAGRPLTNLSLFPLQSRTALAPPLAKFAASPFGILELEADPVLPITVRHVEGPAARGLTIRTVAVGADATDRALIDWQRRVRRYHESSIGPEDKQVATRELSLLKTEAAARAIALPGAKGDDPRPFEVVGLPLPEPGFHVVEVESERLGAALLGKPAPMYVRTTALVTNLGVHLKWGKTNVGVWVTSLDRGKPVAGAEIRISDCNGKPLWNGTSDARGFAVVPRAFPEPDYASCASDDDGSGTVGYFVSARKPIATGPNAGKVDLAFVWSTWNQGIESWRFELPGPGGDGEPGRLVAHTVFDRTLLRAGQTVSMKHYLRREALVSLTLADARALPTAVEITHVGSEQTFPLPLAWRQGRHAESAFALPQDAKLGLYRVSLVAGDRRIETGSFRVEEFRLPVLRGQIAVRSGDQKPQGDFVRPASLSAGVSIVYTNGGSAAALPVRVSAAVQQRVPSFAGYDAYRFTRSEADLDDGEGGSSDETADGASRSDRGGPGQRIVADKLAVTLDKDGNGTVVLKDLPAVDSPRDLRVEATYPDPNGEVQTLSRTVSLWPAAVVVGVRADDWVSVRGKASIKLVALGIGGKPAAGVPLELRGVSRNVRSVRKRMVGGFYAYDNQRESKELGVLCSGKSNAEGLLICNATLSEAGNVELVALAKDAAGNSTEASTSVWVTRQAELWFGGENQDRIDVLPEKKAYAPGEIARFQVRMPFRAATALVAIERDGILATHVVDIRGDDPSIAIKVEADWSPNVYVSVLALRGRIRDVPWYSFFTWGWKSPVEWWRAWRDEGKLYEPPTAMVDLGKPAFKYGIASIRVDAAAHRLKVAVTTDKPDYAVRQVARATVRVTLPDGKPAPAGTEVALAAVDEALLELMPNASWNLFDAMIRERGYGVEAATAQMQIVGKRHYGRKAVPPGGGGGVSPARELFDTLLLWRPVVVLDANGSATVDVPLNDSLTSFRIVAVAEADLALFGTGSATIRARQDLQIVSGLPPLVREGDRYEAGITLRNTTRTAMDVTVDAVQTVAGPTGGAPVKLATRTLRLEPDASSPVQWKVTAPDDASAIDWRFDAKSASASDGLKVTQKVVPAIPVTVQQATLVQLDGAYALPVAAPADATVDGSGRVRGGLALGLKPKLADGLPGVREWLQRYPYGCLEQKASVALGLLDEARWDEVARQIPLYLDADGLASYFPPRPDQAPSGSDVLTAYLLSASAEAGALGRFGIPDATRTRMESGLIAFVEGRLKREQWSAFASDAGRQLDVRKLSAIEALTRTGKATPRMLQSIQVLPNQWPTSAVIDWLLIARRLTALPDRAARLAEADQILRARMTYAGTRLDFSTEKEDFWFWMMASGDGNAARLLIAVLDDPAWKDDAARLVVGALQRQKRGHWLTTTANVWGVLAVDRFSKRFEREPVGGVTRAGLAGSPPLAWSWADKPAGGDLLVPWPARSDKAEAAGQLKVEQDGAGKPWLTVRSRAAVPLRAPFAAGYRVTRTVIPVEQKTKNAFTRGDVVRVRLDIDAQADMSWVVVSDPIPGGASVLGTGLGRDAQLASGGERSAGAAWLAYEEKGFEAFRAYYQFVPKGKFSIEYTIRLNNAGSFGLPPTRVEAMYAPETFGEAPNGALEVGS